MKGRNKILQIYSDNHPSLEKATHFVGANHEGSQPGHPKTNAIIERCNQDILIGTKVLLVAAGLPSCFWVYAGPAYCFYENLTQDQDGKSPWNERHNDEFKGEIIPFGCGVFFLPVSSKYTNSKTAPSMSYGIFLGYRMAPGGKWSGEYLVADIYDFVDMPLDVYA